MNRENALIFLNNFISNLWLLIAIGIIVAVICERKALKTLLEKKTRKDWRKNLSPFFVRLGYIFGGLMLVLVSFEIVNAIIEMLNPTVETTISTSTLDEGSWSFLTILKGQTPQTALIGVMMIILSGSCLILSAGTKWLVNTAKLVLTITAFYIFFSTLSLVA